jgi:hypothetical protein
MKQFIKCHQFYQDIDQLQNLIKSLEFEDHALGQEILNFYYIPAGLQDFLKQVLQEDIEIQPDTGTFRKPSNLIQVDNFYQHALWTCVVALEDTKINICTHKDATTFFDVKDNPEFFKEFAIPENWATQATIALKQNDFILIRPWLWKSLEQDKIVQTFLLNANLGQ